MDIGKAESKTDMHTKAQHACLCIVVALLQLSQAAWVPHSTLPSTRHLSHQRGLQQVQDCISPVWQCSMSAGQQMQLSDATHATVLDGNCTALSTSLASGSVGLTLSRATSSQRSSRESALPAASTRSSSFVRSLLHQLLLQVTSIVHA